MEVRHEELPAPGMGRSGTVLRYGHGGRPVLVLPGEGGRAWDYEHNGMVNAVRDLIEAGRVKLYCLDSFDPPAWPPREKPHEERARLHQQFDGWVFGPVLDLIAADSPGAQDVIATGCSMGAFHALQFALQHSDICPVAICQSGNYDPSTWPGNGRGDAAYFTNPTQLIPTLEGKDLDLIRERVHAVLTVGQGPWEIHPTGSLPSAHHLAGLLGDKGISHELDVWGYDASHDWEWWRIQFATHLANYC